MGNMNKFKTLEADFYHYMINVGGISPKAGRDYIGRLRFLAPNYKLDTSITEEYIEQILDKEDSIRLDRDRYRSKKALTDFRSCLRKFLSFIEYNFQDKLSSEIENEIAIIHTSSNLSQTEKESLIKSRVGQGIFRSDLIKYWGACSISRFPIHNILVASHIKPWKVASNVERLDVYNGLLLLPNYDKLFDLGYISFKDDGKIIISSLIDDNEYKLLGISKNLKLHRIEDNHKKYMEYHRDLCFIK